MRISDWSSDVCSSDLLSGLITLMGPDSVRLIGLSFPPKEFRWAAARLACELHGEPTRPEAAPYAFPVSPEEDRDGDPAPRSGRSEEHTSELQSLMRISYAVFCLKKKKHNLSNKCATKINTTDNDKLKSYRQDAKQQK